MEHELAGLSHPSQAVREVCPLLPGTDRTEVKSLVPGFSLKETESLDPGTWELWDSERTKQNGKRCPSGEACWSDSVQSSSFEGGLNSRGLALSGPPCAADPLCTDRQELKNTPKKAECGASCRPPQRRGASSHRPPLTWAPTPAVRRRHQRVFPPVFKLA